MCASIAARTLFVVRPMHAGSDMTAASADEIAELLGDRADENIVDRIANVGASLDEVTEALDDLDHQHRFGEERVAASPRIEEVRTILEELPYSDELSPGTTSYEEDEHEGLTVIEPDELASEPP